MTFFNTAMPQPRTEDERRRGDYAFERVSPYLRIWSRLFQAVISQAGTYLLTRKFHARNVGIFKAEGGVRIQDVGDLVLYRDRCSWDSYDGNLTARADPLYRLSGLITNVVLGWNPEDPVQTLMTHGAVNCNCETKKLAEAIHQAQIPWILGGNHLSAFWDGDTQPLDEHYWRWCLHHVDGKSEDEVAQFFDDRALGLAYKAKLHEKVRTLNLSMGVSCTPERTDDGLKFYINTGRTTVIDGWKTAAEIEAFLQT